MTVYIHSGTIKVLYSSMCPDWPIYVAIDHGNMFCHILNFPNTAVVPFLKVGNN